MDPRLVQLTRILCAPLETAAAARAAVSARAGEVAEALVFEAAASDDVTSTEAALDYFEARLVYLGDLVGPAAAAHIRNHFRVRISAW